MNPVDGQEGKFWSERVLKADAIWAQVKKALAEHQLDLPKTPRKPDLRLIINNITGGAVQFLNPGDHSGNKQEVVPGQGEKTAAMVMLKGTTLEEQETNAQKIYTAFDLGTHGLSGAFVQALTRGELNDLIREAYGPAPFEEQTSKLMPLHWTHPDGRITTILPVFGNAAAYGTRNPEQEAVFLTEYCIFVRGTSTVAEKVDSDGICIAISKNWQSGVESTRPIATEVAREFYGKYFENIPVVQVSPDGFVAHINLKNGKQVHCQRPVFYEGYEKLLENPGNDIQ